jgi:dTDP-4-dehydrorhamnose reductase
MTWLIAGGSGQLGIALQGELKAQHVKFFAPNSNEMDITNSAKVHDVVNDIKPAVIINAAAWTDVDGAEMQSADVFNVNATGAKNLASAAKSVNAVLVQISTDYIFSGTRSFPWSENSKPNPVSVYGASKNEGERLVSKEYPERTFTIRTAWLYSENGRNFAKTMTKLALKDSQIIRVVKDQIGQPTYARDLALKIIQSVKFPLVLTTEQIAAKPVGLTLRWRFLSIAAQIQIELSRYQLASFRD